MLATCPSENVLSGFALGQLPENELDEVAQHVDMCTNCRETLASGAIGDTLVAELRRQNGTEPCRTRKRLLCASGVGSIVSLSAVQQQLQA